eukprot:g30537.t1
MYLYIVPRCKNILLLLVLFLQLLQYCYGKQEHGLLPGEGEEKSVAEIACTCLKTYPGSLRAEARTANFKMAQVDVADVIPLLATGLLVTLAPYRLFTLMGLNPWRQPPTFSREEADARGVYREHLRRGKP